ncbi:hypothetical protein HA402_000980 [Bradysia odoriphaga]|nr:hypothetical protein HA402_000980 [Bradysia odoriphaga]
MMKNCETMVAAAYSLSRYVPNIQSKNESDFWEGTVINIVVQTLNQDVLARSMISKCFGRIRDLGVVIQNVYRIVKRSRGSKWGIAVAITYVPAALEKITDCINTVEKLDINSITTFAGKANTFIKIIGSEAAKFTEEKMKWYPMIQKARDAQQNLETELGIKKGEVERNHYLMRMAQKYVDQNEAELQAAKRRIDDLHRLNQEVENAIKNIPQTVGQTISMTRGICFGGWWFRWACIRRTEYDTIQVPNQDREAQERYYSNVMASRVARRSRMETDEAAKQALKQELEKELGGYIYDYNRTVSDLKHLLATFNDTYAAAEKNITYALNKQSEIERRAAVVSEKIGSEGTLLIETLEHIEAFSRTLNSVATTYSPFAAILNTIKSLVEAHVSLLSSDEQSDIFLAATLLIEQAKFLSEYVIGAQQILYKNQDNSGTSIRRETETIFTFINNITETDYFRNLEPAPSNLWDNSPLSNQKRNVSGISLGNIDPGQLEAFERNNRNAIIVETVQFASAMKSCEDIVVAVFKVADYVPAFHNNTQSTFWNETVNPILVQTLHQHVTARSVITKSLGTIVDLVVVIQNVYEIMVLSRGSKKATEIARNNIEAAVNNLSECITRVELLNSNAITSFAKISQKIFEIIGPEAGNFTKLKEPFDKKIMQERKQQQKLILELATKKGEVESISYLIDAGLQRIDQTLRDLVEAKKRRNELVQLNDEIERIIYCSKRKYGFVYGMRYPPKFSCVPRMYLENSQRLFYENIIKSREERIQIMAKDENAKQIAKKQMEKELAGYKLAYRKAKEELDHYQIVFPTYFTATEIEIQKATAAKLAIDKNALNTYEKIGLHGNVLLDALSQVRTFATTLQAGASAYSPFAAILRTIKTLLDARVGLLSSDVPSDIFLAATLLLEQVEFLSNYIVSAQQILKTNDGYDDQTLIQKLNKVLSARSIKSPKI